jgi:hypothetical protein
VTAWRAGLLRAGITAVAAGGLVLAAGQTPGSVALGPRTAADTSREGASSSVRLAQLICPGPELQGVEGVDDLPVGATVGGATAPLRALSGLRLAPERGSLTVQPLGGSASAGAPGSPGLVRTEGLDAPRAAVVTATDSLAPGLSAAQGWLVPDGDQRALVTTSCGPPAADAWLVVGGGAAGRQERLVLANPGDNTVTVDVTVHGAEGPIPSSTGKGLIVPPRSRTSLLVDSISGAQSAPVIHVVATGGLVHATVNDYWLDGSVPAGSDDTIAAATPAREQVIPAVPVGGRAVLRVAVPGEAEAVVQARALTGGGPKGLPGGGVIRVPGGATRDLDISGLPTGVHALQVRADVPVVAGAVAHRRASASSPGDFAWSSSSAPVVRLAGAPLLDLGDAALTHRLSLSSVGGTVGVEVVTTAEDGTPTSRRLTVAADTAVSVELPAGAAAVWVNRLTGSGRLHAGLASETGASGAAAGLVSAMPLADAPLQSTSVSLVEVP